MKAFTVTAERGPSGAWVLECDELGLVSQTRRLDRAEDEVAEGKEGGFGVGGAEVHLGVMDGGITLVGEREGE